MTDFDVATGKLPILAIAVYQLHAPGIWQRVYPRTGQRGVPEPICDHCSMLANRRVAYPCRTVEIVDSWVGPPREFGDDPAEVDRLKAVLGVHQDRR